jgi:hypothetical protein
MLKWLIVDWPETADILDEEERAILIRRLQKDRASGIARMDRLDKYATKRLIKDWKIYGGYVDQNCRNISILTEL